MKSMFVGSSGVSGGRPGRQRRRGAVVIQVAVCLTTLVGFMALAIDVGVMYNTRAELQRTVDAAALAAAAALGDGDQDYARGVAEEYTHNNKVFGDQVDLKTDDVIFGRAHIDDQTGRYVFEPDPGHSYPNAVRVRARHNADFYFAGLVPGIGNASIAAQATAVLTPRDIVLVVDLSASHNDDSELRHYDETDVNLMDVWAALPIEKGNNGVGNGVDPPPPGNPNNPNDPPGAMPGAPANQGGNPDPGADPQGGMQGPTWGWLTLWGDPTSDEGYDPTTDTGLSYLPRYQNWTDEVLTTWYQQAGYSDAEITALMSSTYDGSQDSGSQYAWTNRVAVALGLARWDSGLAGGLWEDVPPGKRKTGNGNSWVASGELTWLVDYPFDSGSWSDYIYNYVASSSTEMYYANHSFRYRFGLKTFINYVLERKPSSSQTPELAQTPSQPMQAVKDAAVELANILEDLEGDDMIGLAGYGTVGYGPDDKPNNLSWLTTDFDEVRDQVADLQAGMWTSNTNVAQGIDEGVDVLFDSEEARSNAAKVMILLTDGIANQVRQNPTFFNTTEAKQDARQAAAEARDLGVQIYTISVGVEADQELMKQIADGSYPTVNPYVPYEIDTHFHAEGEIAAYEAQLQAIFQSLGGQRPVVLIE